RRRAAVHRDRATPGAHGRGRSDLARPSGRLQGDRRSGHAAGGDCHAARGRADRASAERRRSRLPGGGRLRRWARDRRARQDRERKDLESCSLRATALLGQPLTADLATLLLGGASPDAGVLVGRQRELQAGLTNFTFAAYGLGVLDLLDRRTSGADGEEEIGIG